MGVDTWVQCCIVGAGPAGQMLALLLARYGLQVRVLEKHVDFLRDFRGDTIHPSTMQNMHELGLLTEFLKLPHQKVERLGGYFAGEPFTLADFRRLPSVAPYIAMLPQWDFLNFLREQAEQYSGYRLDMNTAATDLLWEGERVVGVSAKGPSGPFNIRAALTIAADGRHSLLRGCAGLPVEDLGAPMDVLWLRLPKEPEDSLQTMGLFDRGRIVIMIDRGSHWQVAYVIPKGGYEALRAQGFSAFQQQLAGATHLPADRVSTLHSWDDVKLLTVKVDRLRSWWKPGFLAIGDAAHAMSPIGGVGVNLAIQDAVATANLLARPLRGGACLDADLAAVQARRLTATERTQRMQLLVQNRSIVRALAAAPVDMPLALKLLRRAPWLQRLPARLIGLGFQPENVSNELRYA